MVLLNDHGVDSITEFRTFHESEGCLAARLGEKEAMYLYIAITTHITRRPKVINMITITIVIG